MGKLDGIARAGFGHVAFSMANTGPKSTGSDFKLTHYHCRAGVAPTLYFAGYVLLYLFR
jgi:hypothetical protein